MKISGSRAVVTGGASGIGRAIVDEMTKRGCQVVTADVGGARAKAVAAEVSAGATAVRCDVADLWIAVRHPCDHRRT